MSTRPKLTEADLLAMRAKRLAREAAARATSHDLSLPTGETSILCPCCGHGAYLHHENVDVYMRGEDDAVCLHTRVSRWDSTTSMSSGQGNPSRRRHGLTIDLWCENCEARSRLEIAQHKGQTTVSHLCVEPAADQPTQALDGF